ncbi:RadC family protein [Dyadobacter sediminis]|uniref:DNA repair protein RadC n=1 Tax=Dyadobacter sediminis TaxID=1493691 RepID=A0A5R9KAU4_9BACT|nr:DNA repair protein RadC [Dyadobacter sediminis]TLU91926.1 DNA repair protein RadC [Dyadobacter sediminis]GGB99059.1 DNA repair protein RadC [Dyadobacter sediminis]
MSKKNDHSTRKIRSWFEEDRPREKLLLKGRAALSDAELIAILIGSGTVDLSAVDVGKQIMNSVGNNINELAKLGVTDLTKIRGIGEAKAITIVAALELGRRRNDITKSQKRKITAPADVYEEMKQYLLDKAHEEFWIMLLNRANDVTRTIQVSVGGVSGTVVDVKVIFKLAIDHLASSVILVHNHPSGQLQPSHADRQLTMQVKEAGRLLDIPILDHMIFTDNGFYSFLDSGEI